MKNKYQRMDEFFNFIRQIIVQNPNLDFVNDPDNIIYTAIVRFDTPKDDNNTTLDKDGIFDNWKRRFANNEQIKINVSDNNSFIKIINQKFHHSPKEFISLYIPLNHNIIESGLILLIDFLNREKIEYVATISKSIKSDDIVINIVDPSAIDIICEFVKSNQYLQAGLIKPNPFIFNYKGLAMTTGNTLSYNYVLTEYIKLYLQERKKDNQLDEVCLQDFIHFMTDYYNKVFISRSKLNNHLKHFDINPNKIVNYMNITELILKCNDPNFDFDSFISHYQQYKDSKIVNDKAYKFRQLNITKDEIDASNALLSKLYDYLSQNNDEFVVIEILKQIIYDEELNLITRDDELREKIHRSNFIANMRHLLQSEQMELDEYLKQHKIAKKSDKEIKHEVDQILVALLTKLSENKDLKQAIKSVALYIETNDYRLITRNDKLREYLISKFFRIKMLSILQQENITFEEYAKKLADTYKIAQHQYLEKAITKSFDHYEELLADLEEATQMSPQNMRPSNANFEFKFDAKANAIFCLKQFLKNGIYTGFTRTDNARKELVEHVTKEDALKIIRKALNVNSTSLEPTDEEIDYLVDNYIELVLNQHDIKKRLGI